MAGIDYSHVKEPAYDPDKIRQSSEISRYIETQAENILTLWDKRQAVGDQMRNNHAFAERSRRIFYDTDSLYETQHETLRNCSECGGVLKIDSASDRGYQILAIHVPRKACHECREQGYEWYDSGTGKKYDIVFLQDRSQDQYQSKKPPY